LNYELKSKFRNIKHFHNSLFYISLEIETNKIFIVTMAQQHLLHEAIADAIQSIIAPPNQILSIELDQACKGKKHLTFFLSFVPSRESAISKVDIIVMKDNKIKLVCEIEESGLNPGKFFGKVFSTASAKVCRLVDPYGFRYIDFDENAIFIQIVSNSSFNDDVSLKEKQGQLIENEIFHKLATFNSWIKKYRLIFGDIDDFTNPQKDGYKQLERIIQAL
jgi:hypothetical protein